MSKKTIISIIAFVLLTGVVNALAGEKCRHEHGEKTAKKPHLQKQDFGRQQQFDNWFIALKKAYSENDREKVGKLIQRMEQRKKGIYTRKGGGDKEGKRSVRNHHRADKRQFGNCCRGCRKFGRGHGRGSGQRGMGMSGRGFRQQGRRGFCSGRKGAVRKGGWFQHRCIEEYEPVPYGRGENDFDWDW